MPSKSKRQHDFMLAVANDKKFARKVGVPQKVGKDFAAADKAKLRTDPNFQNGLGGQQYTKPDKASRLYRKKD